MVQVGDPEFGGWSHVQTGCNVGGKFGKKNHSYPKSVIGDLGETWGDSG